MTGKKSHAISRAHEKTMVKNKAAAPTIIVTERIKKPTTLIKVLTRSAPKKLSSAPLPPLIDSRRQGENKVRAKRLIEKKLLTNQR